MAAQVAKDGVIRARAVQWACAMALVAGLPAAKSSGQQSYYQQQQAFQQQQQQQANLQQAQGYAQQQQQQEQQRRQQQESQLQQQKQQMWEDQQEQNEAQQARNQQDEEQYRQRRMSDEASQQQHYEAEKRRRDQDDWSTSPASDAPDSSDTPVLATQSSKPNVGFPSADVSPAGAEPASSGIRLLVLGGIAATGLTLLGLVVGAIVTLTAVRRKSGIESIDNAQHSSELSAPAAIQAPKFMDRFRSGIETAVTNLRLLFRRALRRGKRLAWRMVPSRRFLVRSAFLLFGTGLVLVSLVGFANGQVLISFIILPIGYAIATCFWLLPWNSTRKISNNQLSAIEAPEPTPIHAAPRPAATRPHLARAAKPTSENMKSTVDYERKPETVRPYHAAHNGHKPEPFTTGTRVQLVCIPCSKQYDVRGEGNIGVRLIPCPQCGSALAAIGAQKIDPIVNDPSWVPIVSVLCKNCRGLIDVPYSTIGTSVACPRCQAALPVPRVAGQVKQELAQDCFA